MLLGFEWVVEWAVVAFVIFTLFLFTLIVMWLTSD